MKTLLINLVSDQTVPNVLCMDYFKPDAVLFLYTGEKFKEIIDFTLDSACMLLEFERNDDNVHKLIISEERIHSNVECINSWLSANGNGYDKIICNITGGTKLMGISLYEAAKSNSKARIVYLPIGKNTLIANIAHKNEQIKLIAARLSVKQFCAAYGAEIINESALVSNISHAIKYRNVSRWLMDNYFLYYGENRSPVYRLLSCLFQKLISFRNDKKFKQHDLRLEYQAKEKLQYNDEADMAKILFAFDQFKDRFSVEESGDKTTIEGVIYKKDVEFFTGGWLEEFCFNEINDLKDETAGLIDDIALNPDIRKKGGANNEIDVMFTSRNNVYMVECKSLEQQHDKSNDILYKINAIQGKVGRLAAKSFLVSTAVDNILEKPKNADNNTPAIERGIKESALMRAKELDTIIVHPFKIAKNLKDEIRKVIEK